MPIMMRVFGMSTAKCSGATSLLHVQWVAWRCLMAMILSPSIPLSRSARRSGTCCSRSRWLCSQRFWTRCGHWHRMLPGKFWILYPTIWMWQLCWGVAQKVVFFAFSNFQMLNWDLRRIVLMDNDSTKEIMTFRVYSIDPDCQLTLCCQSNSWLLIQLHAFKLRWVMTCSNELSFLGQNCHVNEPNV